AVADIGGFPEVPLMEDVEFFRRLHSCGRVNYSDKRILVSPRRYEAIGRTRLTLAYGFIATLYIFGTPLSMLASIYKRMCCDAGSQSKFMRSPTVQRDARARGGSSVSFVQGSRVNTMTKK